MKMTVSSTLFINLFIFVLLNVSPIILIFIAIMLKSKSYFPKHAHLHIILYLIKSTLFIYLFIFVLQNVSPTKINSQVQTTSLKPLKYNKLQYLFFFNSTLY